MSSNGNGKRSDFYKKRAIEIADFLFSTKTFSDNPYVKLVTEDVHPIVEVILKNLTMADNLSDFKSYDPKYRKTDFISDAALSAMKNKQKIDLRYEHLVPKRQYLFDKINSYLSECTEKDQFEEKVYQLLSDIYYVATITKKENDELDKRFKTDMPDGWKQGDNVKARYDEMKIHLNDTGLFEEE